MRQTFRNLLMVSLAALASLAAGGASAQNLVTNGSFESGLTGWTTTPGPECVFNVLPAGGTSTGAGAWVAPAPTEGTNVLLSDATVPFACVISQDVALPALAAGSQYVLTLAAGYNFRDFGIGSGGCSLSVDVTTTGGAPIANVYSAAGDLNEPLAPRAAVNLTAQAGTTVRIIGTATGCLGGPVGLVLDNVVLAAGVGGPQPVPTMSEWMMILLALTMVGTAVVAMRRNRT